MNSDGVRSHAKLAHDRRERASGPLRARPFDAALQLRLVTQELMELMGADGSVLTLHADGGGYPTLLFADATLSDSRRDAMLAVLTHDVRTDFEDGCAFWRNDPTGSYSMYIMPVDRMAGHSRLLISLLFAEPDRESRARAEGLFRDRRPFATGFFQLWQHNRVLEQRGQSLESVLDQTAIGLILLSRDRQITFANQMAEEILAAGEGIGRANGTVRAVSLMDGVNLQAALSHAIGDAAAAKKSEALRAPLLAFQRRGAPPLVATILRAQSPIVEAGDVAAVMYLVDPRLDTAKMISPLCRLYGLSTVETNLVCLLAAGETITSAAQTIHVKEQTARTYLKAIFAKTGTRRQTELVVLMLSSLIRMKRDVLQEALPSSGGEWTSQSAN